MHLRVGIPKYHTGKIVNHHLEFATQRGLHQHLIGSSALLNGCEFDGVSNQSSGFEEVTKALPNSGVIFPGSAV